MREGTKVSDSLIEQRIQRGIVSQLEAKGLRRVENDPDLLVYTHVRVSSRRNRLQQTSPTEAITAGRLADGRRGPSTATVREIPVGTLIVALVDSRKKLWSGVQRATDTISSDPIPHQEKVDQALAKVFETFPPSPAKS